MGPMPQPEKMSPAAVPARGGVPERASVVSVLTPVERAAGVALTVPSSVTVEPTAVSVNVRPASLGSGEKMMVKRLPWASAVSVSTGSGYAGGSSWVVTWTASFGPVPGGCGRRGRR